MNQEHFQGKSVQEHLLEKKKEHSGSEPHGSNALTPLKLGSLDAQKAIIIQLNLATVLYCLNYNFMESLPLLILFYWSWSLWQGCKVAWDQWSHLEHLHRIRAQEKWEISHHREQEKKELRALYEEKGFSGKLLDDVIHTLTANEERLLNEMLTTEFGLSLHTYYHPLELGLSSFIACLVTYSSLLAALIFTNFYIFIILGVLFFIGAELIANLKKKNSILLACIWQTGMIALSLASIYLFKNF